MGYTINKRTNSNLIPLPVSLFSVTTIPEMVMSCRFLVMLDGTFYGFKSVSGISQRTDYEYIVEGGNNDFPRALRKPKSQPDTLTFSRGYLINKLNPASLMLGNSLDGRKAKALETPDTSGMIFVLDRNGCLQAMYNFTTIGLQEWRMGDLDAMNGSQIIESFTVMHRGLKNIPVPWVDSYIKDVVKTIAGVDSRQLTVEQKAGMITQAVAMSAGF